MSSVLQVDALSKSFPVQRSLGQLLRAPFRRTRKQALDGCSLAVAGGERVALIGPNGAGKTTLARILCGTVLGDGGQALIDGLSVEQRAARRAVSLARPDDPALHPRLSTFEALLFHARLYGVAGSLRAAIERALAEVEASALIDRRAATLSAGEKARVSLAKALLTRPRLLLLDELSRVLDPGAAQRFRDLLDARDRQGLATLLITHDLEEAARCHRVVVLAQGRVAAEGPWPEVAATAREVFSL